MDFWGIGWQEILLILIVALMIFGPGRLPEIGRAVGKTVRVLKKATSDLMAEATKEIEEQKHPPAQGEKKVGKTDEPTKP